MTSGLTWYCDFLFAFSLGQDSHHVTKTFSRSGERSIKQGMEAFNQQLHECTILEAEPLALFKLSDDASSDILDAAGLVEQQVRPSLSLVDSLVFLL